MTMLLSEAIRLGSMLHPQCFGSLWKRAWDGSVVGTCAIGAAAEAISLGKMQQTPEDYWPYLNGTGLYGDIVHMNDGEHRSREAIADFVAEWEIAHGIVPNRYTVLEGVTA